MADRGLLAVVSSRTGEMRSIGSGIHAISNGDLDAPWPKMRKSSEALAALLAGSAPEDEALFEMLRDTERAPDSELPETGVGLEWERVLSAPFIATPTYGTRSSTVVQRSADGAIRFSERTFMPDGRAAGTNRFVLE